MRRNNQHGSWPLANQELFAALQYAGYECKLEWGEGTEAYHSGTHGASVLPDTIRWMWGQRLVSGGGQEARGVGARL